MHQEAEIGAPDFARGAPSPALLTAILVVLTACAHTDGAPAATQDGAISISLDHVRYDGFRLWGRLLVHADSDVTIDRRLGFEVVRIHDVVDCESGRPASGRLIVDYAWRERTPADLLSLRRGEWFGVDTVFPLFAEHWSPSGGPPCIGVSVDVARSGEPFSGWNASWKGEVRR
jgi:hypothetical protein